MAILNSYVSHYQRVCLGPISFFLAAGMVHPYDKNMCRPPAAEVEHSQLAASWTGPDQCGDRWCGENRIGSHIHWENGDLTTRKMVILWWFNSDLMGFILWGLNSLLLNMAIEIVD